MRPTDPTATNVPSAPWGCEIVVVLLGAILAWRNPDFLNHDGIAYCRISEYWAEGSYRLAINGYWSPVISWIAAALLNLGIPALYAIRIVLVLSAVGFVVATNSLLQTLEIPASHRRWVVWVSALNASFWSIRQITPDLAAAGFFLLYWSYALRIPKMASAASALGAGGFLALASLAKAVYLPVGIICLVLLIVTTVARTPRANLRQLWKPIAVKFGLVLIPVVVAVGAWSIALTYRYGAWTWSTSARINHAATHPPLRVWPNPCMTRLHKPDPGRVTSWEDPSEQPWPPPWRPWTSAAHARHQIELIARNLPLITWNLARIDLLGLGFISMIASLFGARLARKRHPSGPQSSHSDLNASKLPFETLIPIIALTLVYCPFPFVESNPRFFYASLPLLHLTAIRITHLLPAIQRRIAGYRVQWDTWVHGSFLIPPLFWMFASLYGISQFAPAGSIARQLAQEIRAAGSLGPIAGSASYPGGRVGLYVAWMLNQPWYGDEEAASPEAFLKIGARTIVFRRDDPRAKAFDGNPDFRELALPAFTMPAPSNPVRVFVSSPRP